MLIQSAIDWISGTSLSALVRENLWVIPTVQAIHICGITVVVGAALVSELRLASMIATDQSPTAMVQRYLPWTWGALVVMLMTGMLLIVGEPERSLKNQIFWIKMSLVLFGFVLSLLFRRPLLKQGADLLQASSAWQIKPVAWLSLCVWVAVIISGRWIAYT